ncbi:MAG: M20/M25/M40 family metallo-hydrolase, partial [bacterium]|nr:M20/M25/M40 family metallo-hydrolase [bacterium]
MSNDAALPIALDPEATRTFVDACWEDEIVPQLIEYIRIPNKSPLFDPDWDAHGHMEEATQLIADWCRARPIQGLQLEIARLPGRTPLIWMEIPGTGEGTVLLYGHLDKQPEMVGWREGLGPWIPVREGDRLFGRGGADDGYAAFASLTAIEALQRQGIPHARCIVLIEACEESGSFDLPFYIEHLADRIGQPDLVICLDSGCGNYDQLWLTTSLRGIVVGTLRVEILREGVHSGDASGVVPSSFRIARQLISRIENEATGLIEDPAFTVEIPPDRLRQAEQAGAVLDTEVHGKFPWVEGAGPTHEDPTELVLRRTWRAALSVTGQDGLPALADAGNVLRPLTALKLSLRVPPTTRTVEAGQRLRELLERDPPYGAKVSFELSMPGD